MAKSTKKTEKKKQTREEKKTRLLLIAQAKKTNQYLPEEEKLNNDEIGEMIGLTGERVRQIWKDFEEVFQWADEPGISVEEREERLCERDRYVDMMINQQSQKRGQRAITPEIAKRIEELYEEEKERNIAFGPKHKQHLNGKLLYSILVEEGFEKVPCYQTVNTYFKALKKSDKAKEAFVDQVHKKGHRLEMDFGYIDLEIAGEVVKRIPMLIFTLPWSNYYWADLLEDEKRETVIAKIVEVLHDIGGVPEVIVTDNLKQIVINPNAKTPAQKFSSSVLEIMNYYGVSFMACQPRKGNQKGNVEIAVRVIRTQCFTHTYKFDSFQDARIHLKKYLARKNDMELLAEEVAAMKPIRALPYDPFVFEGTRTVDTKIMVRLDNDHYSAPAGLVGEEVEVYTNSTHVRIYHGGVQVAEHLLIPKDEQNLDMRYRVDYRHYKGVLPKKAGSLINSRLLTTNPDLQELYVNNFNSNSKLFIEFLEEMNPMPQDQLRWAAESFLEKHSSTLEEETPGKVKKTKKKAGNSSKKAVKAESASKTEKASKKAGNASKTEKTSKKAENASKKAQSEDSKKIKDKTSQGLNELNDLVLGGKK